MIEPKLNFQQSKKAVWLGWPILFVWASLLAVGLFAGRLLTGESKPIISTWGRMGSSLALVALSCLAYTQIDPRARKYALLIAFGMALGTIGDFFNADLLKFIPLQDGTLGAIVAFGLGHVCYMSAIVGQIREARPTNFIKLFASAASWQLVGLLSWYLIVYPAEHNKALVWPALGYTLLLAGTAGLATGLAFHVRWLWPLALGTGLFLASDLLLAIGMFRGSFVFRSEAVWLTYGPGQMLIVISSWLVATCYTTGQADHH